MFDMVSKKQNFYMGNSPIELVAKYGSPLYVYNETMLRKRCREIKNLVRYKKFNAHYSVKANSNIELLKIVHQEGLFADAMSPGEIFVEQKAGFKPNEILFICNNVSRSEMSYAIKKGVAVSVDSISQLEVFGQINPGGEVFVRFNPGIGVGHSEKVITGGKTTKFGVELKDVATVKSILKKNNLKLIGINQHLGSQFLSWFEYVNAMNAILSIASMFDDIRIVDLGGGFGIPYHKQDNAHRLDLSELGSELNNSFEKWVQNYGKEIEFRVEPGRYIVAECGILLGSVHTKKQNDYKKYVGTDIGFNVMMRKVLYDSYHDIEIYRKGGVDTQTEEKVMIVGNICESGDIIATERLLPTISEGDTIGVLDTGAYGYCMSSNYNNRLRPAEVLIQTDGSVRLIRRREKLQDLLLTSV